MPLNPGSKSKQVQVIKQCENCGDERLMYKDSKFCSRKCMGESRRGSNNPAWRPPKFKGTHSAYTVAHRRVAHQRGKADRCVNGCKADRYQWANISGDYHNVNDYQPMCIPCHIAMDKGEEKKSRHERKKVDRKRGDSDEVTKSDVGSSDGYAKQKRRVSRSSGNGTDPKRSKRDPGKPGKSAKRGGSKHIICGLCGFKLPNPNIDPSSIPLMTEHLKKEHGIG